MNPLRKKMMRDKNFNAFNDSFNIELLKEEIDSALENGADFQEVSAALFSPVFNSAYSEFYEKAKEIIEQNILNRDEFEQLMLANINRETLLIEKDLEETTIENAKLKGKVIVGNADNHKVRSGYLNREIYAIDGIENSLDALNIVFSYLQYKQRKNIDNPMDEENAKQHLFILNMMGNQVTALKNTYDAMIWRDGTIDYDHDKDTITLRLSDKDLVLSFLIGKFRIDQTTTANLMKFLTLLRTNKAFEANINRPFRVKRKPRSIELAFVKDGYIKYQIKKGFSKNHIRYDAKLKASITLYCGFIEDTILPNTNNLSIQDIAIMYAELCELIEQIKIDKPSDKKEMDIDDFYRFPFRMQTNELTQFLSTKTTFTNKQIKSFIDMLTHNPENRVNFWKRPFIKQDNDLLFSLLSISSANTLYIIDEWLLAGGYSLDNRGPLFERYLKNDIQERMDKKGYMCKIHPNSVLRINDKLKEEIDLIAEFSECILIAEVKCVSYPTEARDHYNSHKRFEEGANQINRKIKFIEKYKDVFSKEIPGLAHKPIVRAVIANYPLLTGYSIAGVLCTDIKSLAHYLSEGAIHKGLIAYDEKGVKDTSRAEYIVYYTNEKEFCDYMYKYLSNPISFQAIKELCIWEHIQLSGKNTSPTIIVEAARIKQDHFLNEDW